MLETNPPDTLCEIVRGGLLRQREGANLPGVAVSAPSLRQGQVRPQDRRRDGRGLRGPLVRATARGQRGQELLRASACSSASSKKPEAVARLDEILRVSDGGWCPRRPRGRDAAREGADYPEGCAGAGADASKPSITATQMLPV
ncbi:MAG: hypothetical protein WKH64_17585 [Chloroflexia bacterium]